MPEGDTLFRTATVLRGVLVGRVVSAARGRTGAAALARVAGQRVEGVVSRGKHLLIDFSGGLTLHTHLGMRGAWHHYAPAEAWRRGAARAGAVLEVPGRVVVCFDAPRVELIETRAVALHPALSGLGPDLVRVPPDADAVVARLRAAGKAGLTVAEMLLDQSAMAGIGNVYRCETLFIERVDPFARGADLSDAALARLVSRASELLRANLGGGARTTMPDPVGTPPGLGILSLRGSRSWVYARAGRPCRRCGTLVRSMLLGAPPRRLYWCATCQPGGPVGLPSGVTAEPPGS